MLPIVTKGKGKIKVQSTPGTEYEYHDLNLQNAIERIYSLYHIRNVIQSYVTQMVMHAHPRNSYDY